MNIALPLVITLSLETGIYMILKHRDMKLFIIAFLLNLVLNVSMNIGLSYINNIVIYWTVLSISEVLTIGIESLVITLLMKMKYLKVLIFAVIANITSFVVGLLIQPVYQTKITAYVVCGVFLSVYLLTYGFTLSAFILNYRNRNNNRSGDNEE